MVQAIGEQSRKKSQTPAGLMAEAINKSFAMLKCNYPNFYLKAYPDDDPRSADAQKRIWLDSFKSIKPNDLKRAVLWHVNHSQYLPSVFDIKQALTAMHEDSGMPSVYQAYTDACHSRWSHPVVYAAASGLSFDLKRKPEKTMLPVFSKRYDEACRKYSEDPESMIIPMEMRIEKKKIQGVSKEEGLSRTKKLKELFK